jgi:hypothetical protein
MAATGHARATIRRRLTSLNRFAVWLVGIGVIIMPAGQMTHEYVPVQGQAAATIVTGQQAVPGPQLSNVL